MTATFTATDPENSTIGINAYLSNAGGATFNAATRKDIGVAASGSQRSVTWLSSEAASYLTAGQTYAVRVDAFDSQSLLGQKASSNFVRTAPVKKPPSVGTVNVTQNTDGSIIATFTATDPENSTIGINGYLSNAGGATFNAATKKDPGSAASGTQRSITWSSAEAASYLTAGQTYAVRIDAFDSDNMTEQKASSNFVRINEPNFVVSSFSPNVLTQNQLSTITVFGSGVPNTATLTIADANCGSPYGHTANGFYQDCAPIVAGSKSITVKTQPGGSVVYTNMVTVKSWRLQTR